MGIPLTLSPDYTLREGGIEGISTKAARIRLQHRVRVSKHFMIPKLKHAITQYLEIFSSLQVVRDLLGMLAAIVLLATEATDHNI